ncbi:MAG: hypothetical protein K2X93_01870 [Candidatus Obscuribacterales bacterium]|nr:hypothetical protein [Candidatus Obscuribacterales bacterium]
MFGPLLLLWRSQARPAALGYGYEQEREWAIKELLSPHHNEHPNMLNDHFGIEPVLNV